MSLIKSPHYRIGFYDGFNSDAPACQSTASMSTSEYLEYRRGVDDGLDEIREQDGFKEDAAKTAIGNISKALDMYYMRNTELPQSLEALVEAGTLKAEQLQDPWKKPYQYNVVGTRNYKLCSGGEDGAIGGNDDVCNDAGKN